MLKFNLFALGLLFITSNLSAADKFDLCNVTTPENQVCAVQDFNLIHPTQFVYGKNYVKAKVNAFLENAPMQNQKYLNQRGPQNAVIGPDGQIYIADGHHRTMTYIQLS